MAEGIRLSAIRDGSGRLDREYPLRRDAQLREARDVVLHHVPVCRRGFVTAHSVRDVDPTEVHADPLIGPPSGRLCATPRPIRVASRSEEHTSELQSLLRISYAVFCLKKQKQQTYEHTT